MKLSHAVLYAAFAAAKLTCAQYVSTQNVLNDVEVKTFVNKTPGCAIDPAHQFRSDTPTRTHLSQLIDGIDKNTVYVIADGDHGSPDIRYLYVHIVHALEIKNVAARYYVEGLQSSKHGLNNLTKDFVNKHSKTAYSIVDIKSAMAFWQYLASLNAAKKAAAMSADNGEGIATFDGGLEYLPAESIKKWNIFYTKMLEHPVEAKEIPSKITATLAAQNLTEREKQVFRKTDELDIAYQTSKGWDATVKANTEVRIQKDPIVAKRIADDIATHPGTPAIVFYGLAHARGNANSLASQLQTLLPTRNVKRLYIYGDQKSLITTECLFGYTPNNSDMIILRPGQIQPPKLATPER